VERRQFLKMLPAAGATPAVLAAASLTNAPGQITEAEVERIRAEHDKAPIKTPYVPNMIDRHAHALYDVLRVGAGVRLPKMYHFFSDAIGQPRFDKYGRLTDGVCLQCGGGISPCAEAWHCTTKSDTNMHKANELPAPQALLLERILFILGPDTDPIDAEKLSTGYYFDFRVADKSFSSAPLVRCAVSGEFAALVDEKGSRNLVKIGRELSVHLKEPMFIPPQCRFTLNIYGPEPFVARKDINLFALLDGVGDFPVQ
jgi:hypothetical protein